MARRKRPALLPSSEPGEFEWPEDMAALAPKAAVPVRPVRKLALQDSPHAPVYLHKKKLEQLEGWFQGIANGDPGTRRILLLSGPSGTGKSFSVQHLARRFRMRLKDFATETESIHTVLAKSKYRSLDFAEAEDQAGELLLLDDFCSTLMHADFVGSIRALKAPLVIVVTEPVRDESSLNSWLKAVLHSNLALHVEFNPYPRTTLEKAVRASFEHCVDELVLQAGGDLRSALLAHWVHHLNPDLPIDAASVACDQGLVLFHALGKVLYPRKAQLDFQALWPDDVALFNLYLHQNYLTSIATPEQALVAADAFVFGDTAGAFQRLGDHWKDEYATYPSRALSHVVTNLLLEKRPRISMSKPAYFAHLPRRCNKPYW